MTMPTAAIPAAMALGALHAGITTPKIMVVAPPKNAAKLAAAGHCLPARNARNPSPPAIANITKTSVHGVGTKSLSWDGNAFPLSHSNT